jgi:hypothetical protein
MKKAVLIFIVSSFTFTVSAQVPVIDTNYIGFSEWVLADKTSAFTILNDSFRAKVVHSKESYEYITWRFYKNYFVENNIYKFDKTNTLISTTSIDGDSTEKENTDIAVTCYKYDKQKRLIQEAITEGKRNKFVNYTYYGTTKNIEWKIYTKWNDLKQEEVVEKKQYFYDNLNRVTDVIEYGSNYSSKDVQPQTRKTFNYKANGIYPIYTNAYYYNEVDMDWGTPVQILVSNEKQGLPKQQDLYADRNTIIYRGCCSRTSTVLSNINADFDAQGRTIKSTESWDYASGRQYALVHNSDLLYDNSSRLIAYNITRNYNSGRETKSKFRFYFSNTTTAPVLLRQPKLEIQLYPTIAQNRVTINITQNQNTESAIAIRNTAGNLIKIIDKIIMPQHTEILEITHLPAGNYTCTVTTKDGNSKTERFIVVK